MTPVFDLHQVQARLACLRWRMDFFGVTFLQTAVTGVIGVGSTGVASRCLACGAKRVAECNGFGEGCLVRPAPDSPADPMPADNK